MSDANTPVSYLDQRMFELGIMKELGIVDGTAMAWFKRAARAGAELCSFVTDQPDSTPDERMKMFRAFLID